MPCVVAIIGILASVVLASLNTARSKGNNAAVKANLDNMRAEAAIYYDGTGASSYGTSAFAAAVCPTTASSNNLFADTTIIAALTQAIANGTSTGSVCYATTGSAGAYMMYIPYKTADGSNQGWCVDSTGASKAETTAPTTSSTAC